MFAFASGAAAAALCRRGMAALWRVSRHQDPPENPATRGVRWRDALIWSISLGVGAAVSRLVAQRGAAAAWQAATGSQPPGLDDRTEWRNRPRPWWASKRPRSLALVEETNILTPCCTGHIHHRTPPIARNDTRRSRRIAHRTGDLCGRDLEESAPPLSAAGPGRAAMSHAPARPRLRERFDSR